MELKVYKRHEVPREVAAQVRSYGRIQWPHSQRQSGSIWDYTVRMDAPIHFILMHEEVVVSHACVNWREIEFGGERLKCFGLSTVFTYPAFRKGGHARGVVTAATKLIRESDGDLAMLFCSRPTSLFYLPLSWEVNEEATILFGEKSSPKKYDAVVMMLAMSNRGKRSVERMKGDAVYIGADTW